MPSARQWPPTRTMRHRVRAAMHLCMPGAALGAKERGERAAAAAGASGGAVRLRLARHLRARLGSAGASPDGAGPAAAAPRSAWPWHDRGRTCSGGSRAQAVLASDEARRRAAGEDGAPGGVGPGADGEDEEGEEDEAALDALLADAQRMAGGRRGQRARFRFREPGSDADDASDVGGADGEGPGGADATYADLFGGGGARRARRHAMPHLRAGRSPPATRAPHPSF